MSFREISAWVMGLLMTASGLYYADIYFNAARAIGWATPPVALFVPYVIFVVIWSIVAQAALAIVAPKDANAPADEREKPLLDRAGNWSGYVLAAGAVTALLHFIRQEDGELLFHMIMASLILSQIAEYAFQVFLFRRSA